MLKEEPENWGYWLNQEVERRKPEPERPAELPRKQSLHLPRCRAHSSPLTSHHWLISRGFALTAASAVIKLTRFAKRRSLAGAAVWVYEPLLAKLFVSFRSCAASSSL